MRISTLVGSRVGLLGLGREGLATLAALRRAGHDGRVHAFLDAPAPAPEGVVVHVGPDDLGEVEVLVRSPGFKPAHPLRRAADARGLDQTTATALFLGALRDRDHPVIGITGSKGKSTTSTLTWRTLEQAGVPATLVGNIGAPALDQLDAILAEDRVAVMELSSYQCDDLVDGDGPSAVGLLALFPEHQDWHGSVAAYYAAKLRLLASRRPGAPAFFLPGAAFAVGPDATPVDVPEGLHFADGAFWRGTERLLGDRWMRLKGRHNRANAVMALALAEGFGATPADLGEVLATFEGLPFRLQDEGVHHRVRWINDSLSTAPEAAAAALEAVPLACTLICGGYDRGYDPAPLVAALARSRVALVLLLPDSGAVIGRALREAGLSVPSIEVADLPEAVARAIPMGGVCLFSPGAPSYNVYRSFEERGLHLRRLIG